MERKTRFRALKDDMSNPDWVYGNLIYQKGKPRIQDGEKDLFYTCLENTEGQDTGFFDKYGEAIYEGDIINSHNGQIRHGVIKFHQACFWVHSVDESGETHEELHWAHNRIALEVIGNIYDNPELLK